MAIKFRPLSRASALAIIVFEHPGGPYISNPFGGLMPSLANASGCFNGHSIAWRSLCFRSSCPPISFHVTCMSRNQYTSSTRVYFECEQEDTFQIYVLNNTCGISSETSFIALGCIDFKLLRRSSCVKHTSLSCRDLSFLIFAVKKKITESVN